MWRNSGGEDGVTVLVTRIRLVPYGSGIHVHADSVEEERHEA
ncbi:hypothetical protein [Streptomyces sp. NPDC029526]